jgi:hypothetical protein
LAPPSGRGGRATGNRKSHEASFSLRLRRRKAARGGPTPRAVCDTSIGCVMMDCLLDRVP